MYTFVIIPYFILGKKFEYWTCIFPIRSWVRDFERSPSDPCNDISRKISDKILRYPICLVLRSGAYKSIIRYCRSSKLRSIIRSSLSWLRSSKFHLWCDCTCRIPVDDQEVRAQHTIRGKNVSIKIPLSQEDGRIPINFSIKIATYQKNAGW